MNARPASPEAGSPANDNFEDLDQSRFYALWALIFALLFFYYLPCLIGKSEWYVSDLTYYFQPFCKFIGDEVRAGRFPLWNPFLYCGMPQIAVPSPSLFYPFSWLMFLLPFSAGISLYMIIHQVIAALGTYLYLRDLGSSKAASTFGAAAVTLCAYNFAFIRNCTLPASIAWLPLALYFERQIFETVAQPTSQSNSSKVDSNESVEEARASAAHLIPSRLIWMMIGLAISVSMLVQVGRPEVGAPELILLGIAVVSKPALSVWKRTKIRWKELLCKCAAIGLGLGLALPTVAPCLEWAALSPRAQGLALKWVLLWSANWYDFLSMVLSQPLGDLMKLNDHTSGFRNLVLSRGGYLPFLSSTYISPFPITFAVWGIVDSKNRLRWLYLFLLLGFVLMAAGNNTPFAASIVKLSPFLATFRYPVKLMIFPALILILLAVHGIDMILQNRIPVKVAKVSLAVWLATLIVGVLLYCFPAIGITASKIHWFIKEGTPLKVILESQVMFAGSLMLAASYGIAASLAPLLVYFKKISPRNCAVALTAFMALALMQSSFYYRSITSGGFYDQPSALMNKLAELRKQDEKEATDLGINAVQSATSNILSKRNLNLYFDPLTVPQNDPKLANLNVDEKYFTYSRESVLYNIVQCWRIPSSFGYEAAETGDYKALFTEAYSKSSQLRVALKNKGEVANDFPIHRFAALTATDYVNTQNYQIKPENKIPKLNKNLFDLVYDDEKLNHRIYKVKAPRPRLYFTDNLDFVESFKDVDTMLCCVDDRPETRVFDQSKDISYLLNRDYEKFKDQFKEIGKSKTDFPANSSSSSFTKPRTNSSSTSKEGTSSSLSEKNAAEDSKIKSALKENDNCQFVFDNGQEQEIKLNTRSTKVLIIADRYYPGWEATLDGNRTDILKANLLNRAIIIPPGSHSLHLAYRPFSLKIAFIAAGIAVFAFMIFVWAISRKR